MSTKSRNPYAEFFYLIKKLPRATKEELVWQFSNMLTDSLSEFYEKMPTNYNKMIVYMRKEIIARDQRLAIHYEMELKRRRSAILHRLQKMGIDTTNWSVVNKFMRNPRIAGKTLGEMDTEEMDLLIPKLEAIMRKDEADLIGKLAKTVFSAN